MENIALINYSSSNGWYLKGQNRLIESMKQFGYKGEMYMFKDVKEFNSEPHAENPYAFKIRGIDYALSKGHSLIWWMDSSIYPIKDIAPILKIVEEKGYFFEQCGFTASQWTNDKTLNYFNISRDEATKIGLFSAGFIILDFKKELVKDFFERWKKSCDAGMFKGSWTNQNNSESSDPRCLGHRHDLSCASIIAYQLEMTYSPGGTFLSYVGSGYATPKDSCIFYLQPVV